MFQSKGRYLASYSGTLAILVIFFAIFDIRGQTEVDKTVATVSDGLRTELITYSDLRWQLALQPKVELSPPTSQDLNTALQLVINQRIFSLEAERLPRTAPTEEAIQAEVKRILAQFSSPTEFERRLRTVGFASTKDANFERIISKRISIEKYLDFRFRSFIVITPEEITKHYNETFVPNFRRRFPGILVPTIEEKRAEISDLLTESKVVLNIESFLDDAKRRVEVIILKAV